MYAIGVDIGGTKSVVSLGYLHRETWEIVRKGEKYVTKDYSPKQMIDCLCRDITAFAKEVAGLHLIGIGISCGGPLNSAAGIILSPPNLPGWDDIRIVEIIQECTHLKCWLMNDANASAIAEWKYGAGRSYHHLAFLTFGTGLGAGLILDDRLYSGRNDMAGEVGHVRLRSNGPVGYGKEGSFEGFCSGGGIQQLAYTMVLCEKQKGKANHWSLDRTSAADVGFMARQGDELALRIFERVGKMLGEGVSKMIDLLNLERIILGGIYMRCEPWILPAAQAVIQEEVCLESLGCELVPSQLGESIGDIAALSIPLYWRSKDE